MMCQQCGNKPATFFFEKIINGDKTEYHLCESCAREKGEIIPGTPNGFSIHNLLSGLLDFDPNGKNIGGTKQQPARCEECGLTYTQFSKIGRFGCSSCYKYFADRLDPLLKRVHGNVVHVGKVPVRTGGRLKQQREIDRLKRELQLKIEREEFEAAASIRDRIRELERKLSNG